MPRLNGMGLFKQFTLTTTDINQPNNRIAEFDPTPGDFGVVIRIFGGATSYVLETFVGDNLLDPSDNTPLLLDIARWRIISGNSTSLTPISFASDLNAVLTQKFPLIRWRIRYSGGSGRIYGYFFQSK